MDSEEESFSDAIAKIIEQDDRYEFGAYVLVRMSLDYTVRRLFKRKEYDDKPGRFDKDLEDMWVAERYHVSGAQLLEGIGDVALGQFGPMAHALLGRWGVTESKHFGDIVFNMVEAGLLGKTERDSPSDFHDMLDFNKVFVVPYTKDTPCPLEVIEDCSSKNAEGEDEDT
ncbi:MAG: hypothetical protein LBD14_01820 [Puniceicoccales bacterium]|jgi:uncharacterized repeat protein (TIGR04138 family)|nr:hypothetical protein [Puniceicoccales bacterium]